ncbi:Hypothetical protein R9X50_00181800 [Acrodontium crateriforme]|uniref:Aminoglycoside phosphotransferase domain-containing protein n=1 Tax=Acrodontium crateriforme TaxID=150365 RepID=A0AAQ3M174_9PEZI|nr:Hypothetical protein R9X50_00181800 [Acrodontium crateriforme]
MGRRGSSDTISFPNLNAWPFKSAVGHGSKDTCYWRLLASPFDGVGGFRHHLRAGLRCQDDLHPEIKRLIDLQESPVFTHGDLSSLNILARGDDIVGIIDWETAGWYPSYWEYTTAWPVNPHNRFWRKEIDQFLTPVPEALEMEILRQRYF